MTWMPGMTGITKMTGMTVMTRVTGMTRMTQDDCDYQGDWDDCDDQGEWDDSSSETQGQSVGSGEKAARKFSSKGRRAPGLEPTLTGPFPKIQADAGS